jgi:hypothetical protein
MNPEVVADIDVDALEAEYSRAYELASEYRRQATYLRRLIHSVRVLRGEIDPEEEERHAQAQPALFPATPRPGPRTARERTLAARRAAAMRERDEALELARRSVVVTDTPTTRVVERVTANGGTDAPTGAAAVRLVMSENPRPWRVSDLHRELERRGWVTPDIQNPRRTTDATVSRLLKQGEIRRLDAGVYIWNDPPPTKEA